MIRTTIDGMRLAISIGLICSACSATLGESLCGNGILDPGEQCDDGNVKPLDGCSANCEIEQPTSCKTSTENAIRAALGNDREFNGMLTRAESLGYVITRFKRPLQCSEGPAPTTYLAMLRSKDKRRGHAVIIYRTDMPQWMRTAVIYTAGDLDQYVMVPLVTLHVDRRNDPPTVEIFDPTTGKRVEAAPTTTISSTPQAVSGAASTTSVGGLPCALPAAVAKYVPK